MCGFCKLSVGGIGMVMTATQLNIPRIGDAYASCQSASCTYPSSSSSSRTARMLLAPTDDPLVFEEHSAAECDFDTYDAAAHAGLVALGAADGQLVEDERADPVGGGC